MSNENGKPVPGSESLSEDTVIAHVSTTHAPPSDVAVQAAPVPSVQATPPASAELPPQGATDSSQAEMAKFMASMKGGSETKTVSAMEAIALLQQLDSQKPTQPAVQTPNSESAPVRREATTVIPSPSARQQMGDIPAPPTPQKEVFNARLTEIQGLSVGMTVTVTTAEMFFGREATNQICIPHPTVSRRHARIFPNGRGGFNIQDLGSTNGTFCNEERIREKELKNGDILKIGIIAVYKIELF